MSSEPKNEAVEESVAGPKPPFLRRVRIRGYKSIAFCDVTLQPLTILVGRNGSGKSNFVDGLGFLRDVVVLGVQEAVTRHGGRDAVRCRAVDSLCVSIEVDVAQDDLPGIEVERWSGRFAVEIELPEKAAPRIVREHCCLDSPPERRSGYTIEAGRVEWTGDRGEPALPSWPNHDRLFLEAVSCPEFVALLGRLRAILPYRFAPDTFRRPQKPTPGEFLASDGSNLASVIATTREVEPWAVERVSRYLHGITDTVEFTGVGHCGEAEVIRFRPSREGQAGPVELDAADVSNGTLRGFAALMAAFQQTPLQGFPGLVIIEEPETALHPHAMRVLAAAFDEATSRTQILLVTHSTALLEAEDVKPSNIRVVEMLDGKTVIGPVDQGHAEIIDRQLNTLAGLERYDSLHPDLDDLDRQRALAGRGEVPDR